MKNPLQDWFEVFKVGSHTDSSGNTKTWTEEELKQIADTYNKQSEHEAPIVVGHPKTDSPAFAWVDGLMYKSRNIVCESERCCSRISRSY
jgi:hypothetical protein